jgi:membrane peptidoglycan carboxypeptidase
MTQDDPDTAEDESRLRKGDFGKTGTADYGDIDQYDDSVFVYHHGRYVISVWLERADGNGVVHPANDVVDRIVRFIDRMDVRH